MAFFDKFHDLDIWLPFINVKRERDKKKERNGKKMGMVKLFWETRVLSDQLNLSRCEGLFVRNARNITFQELSMKDSTEKKNLFLGHGGTYDLLLPPKNKET